MGIPQSPPEEKDGSLKPSRVAGEDSDTRQRDKVEARVGGCVQTLGLLTHQPPTGFLAIWSNLEETIVRAGREKAVSSSYMECFRHGAQTRFSPKEAMDIGQKRYDLFTSFVLEESGITGLGGKGRAQDFPVLY